MDTDLIRACDGYHKIIQRAIAGMLIEWYDFICFGIVGIATFGALYVLCCCNKTLISSSHVDDHNVNGTTSPAVLHESLLPLQGHQADEEGAAVVEAASSSSPPPQIWTSCWRGIHPAWLLATRFVSFVVLCIFLTWDVLLYDCSIFVYYTEWTFMLLIVYFAIGTVMSAYGCVLYYSTKLAPPGNGTDEDNALPKENNGVSTRTTTDILKKEKSKSIMMMIKLNYRGERRRLGFWSYLLQISYQTCAGAVILTDIVFWFIILPFSSNTHLRLNLLMGGMHSLNIIFLLLDTSLNILPLPWTGGLACFVLWSCCYVIFQWVIHSCGLLYWWPYPFLQLSTPSAPLWYLCLAVIHLPCYGIYWVVVALKNSIFPRWFPQAFVKY